MLRYQSFKLNYCIREMKDLNNQWGLWSLCYALDSKPWSRCDNGSALYQLSQPANWEQLIELVHLTNDKFHQVSVLLLSYHEVHLADFFKIEPNENCSYLSDLLISIRPETFPSLPPSDNITKLEQLQKIFHLHSFWNVELSTDASADIPVDYRFTSRSLYQSVECTLVQSPPLQSIGRQSVNGWWLLPQRITDI